MVNQSLVCIIAIVICKQVGLITNLAPFDTNKAKTCKYNDGLDFQPADSKMQGFLSPSCLLV